MKSLQHFGKGKGLNFKMKLKKILLGLAAFGMALFVFPVLDITAQEPMTGQCGENVTWVLDSEGTLTLSGEGRLFGGLPSEIEKAAVKVVINEGITGISRVFMGNDSIQYVEFPDTLVEIEEEAIRAVAKKAIERKTGARGLRSILEGVMTDIMYDIPSRDDVKKCIITKETIENGAQPTVVTEEDNKNIA